MLRRSLTVARFELRYVIASYPVAMAYVLVPFGLMAFVKNSFQIYLRAKGLTHATGIELLGPGTAALYSFLALSHLGLATYNEHQWGVWDRRRAGPSSTAEVVLGKVLAHYLLVVTQFVLVIGGAFVVWQVDVSGVVGGLVLLVLAMSAVIVAWGWLGIALVPTNALYDAWTYGAGVFLAAIGGALSPYGLLPHAVQTVSRLSPIYWIISGFQTLLLDDGRLSSVWKPFTALCGFALIFAVLAMLRFDADEPKRGRLQ